MSEKIDLRGMSCPEPVIRTKKLFDNKETLCVEALVDDDVCVANLERLSRSLKAGCVVRQENGFFAVTIDRSHGGESSPPQATQATLPTLVATEKLTVVFLTRDVFGEGDREFSQTLINVFLQTLYESGHRPKAVLLANSGVKLLAPESATQKVLADFRSAGCEVLACGLCVEYYGLKEKIEKAQITNMFAICEYLAAADKVISPS